MCVNEVEQKDLNYIVNQVNLEFKAMSGKNLLITGGAGFLGYYLIKSILHWNDSYAKEPIKLWVYDNFQRGLPDWLAPLEIRDDIEIIKHDITTELPNNGISFSYIIHAASIASPTYYRLYPIETMDANVQGLRHLLNNALKQKGTLNQVEGFLFFSTSEIYGDPTPNNIPTPETYRGNVSCTGPRACYDESKRYGETLCINFARHHKLPIKIARPFNNYGPGLKISDRRVIPDFAKDIFNGRDIILLSDGTPTRTYCYVADAIIGYYKILVNGHNGEAYNIGVESPEISIKKLAKIMMHIGEEFFKYRGKLVYKMSDDREYLTDNPNRRCPDISKARKELGYSPSIDLNEGMLRTMYWYSHNLYAEDA